MLPRRSNDIRDTRDDVPNYPMIGETDLRIAKLSAARLAPSEGAGAPPRLGFGPFELDVSNRRLLRGEGLVTITPRVFDILLVLVTQAGQPVDKDCLLARVWGDTAVEEGNLARQISTLRKVLGDATDEPSFVVTLPGRGYQFIAPVRLVAQDAAAGGTRHEAVRHSWCIGSVFVVGVGLGVGAAAIALAVSTWWSRRRRD
jgi:DNA-binding winged helix-turn-helix (wHTH) protein